MKFKCNKTAWYGTCLYWNRNIDAFKYLLHVYQMQTDRGKWLWKKWNWTYQSEFEECILYKFVKDTRLFFITFCKAQLVFFFAYEESRIWNYFAEKQKAWAKVAQRNPSSLWALAVEMKDRSVICHEFLTQPVSFQIQSTVRLSNAVH